MKKRIISLILVAVMSLLCFASCAYNYAQDDMTKYASFDKDAFLKALETLVIEDGDFGTVQSIRLEKVQDKIYSTLAGKVDVDNKLYEGIAGKFDVYYYCYYYTAEIDGETYYFSTSTMQESKATKIQLGLSSHEGLNEKIVEALAGYDLTDKAYKTNTENKTKSGDTIYVTYTESYSVPKLDDKGEPVLDKDGEQLYEEKKTTYTLVPVVLPTVPTAQEGEEAPKLTFEQQLVDKSVGSVSEIKVKKDVEGNGTEREVKYSSISIGWIVDNETAATVITDKTYTEKKEVADTEGVKHDLKDVELQYHIYPVYYNEVAETLNATLIFMDLIGSSITAKEDFDGDGEIGEDEEGTLPIFDDETLKNGEKTISALIEELSELIADYDEAKKALDDAKTAVTKAEDAITKAGGEDKATTTQKNALKTAKEDLDEAQKEFDDQKKKVDDKITEVLACGEDVESKIVEQYNDYVYEGLEDAYKAELQENLSVEIFALAKKYISYNKDENGRIILPWNAVNEAYNRLMNNYRYKFYTGNYTSSSSSSSTTSSTVSNYKQYNGDFNAYLRIAAGLKSTSTMQEVYDAIGAEAEESVKDIVLVYTLANIYGDEVAINNEDIDEFKKSFMYILLVYQVGEENVDQNDFIHAIQFDKVMDHILEIDESDDESDSLVVKFKRLQYTIKVAEEK